MPSTYPSGNLGQADTLADRPDHAIDTGFMPLENLNWRRSSRSGENGGNCVELADVTGAVVAVRDSKDPDGPVLLVPRRPIALRPGDSAVGPGLTGTAVVLDGDGVDAVTHPGSV